jgi:hypothetical protein
MLSLYLRLGLSNGLFPSGFPTITYTHSSSSPFVPHVPPTTSTSTCYSNYTCRRVQIMQLLFMQFSPPSCHCIPLRYNIFFSAPCSETPSVYVPTLMSGTMFHTHIEPQAKLVLYIPTFTFFTLIPCCIKNKLITEM